MRLHGRMPAAVLAALLTLAGCGAATEREAQPSAQPTSATDLTVAIVTHAPPGDKFWDVVKNGGEQAGRDLGVKVTYQGSGDPNEQSQLVDAAVSQQVDGLVVSMGNPGALKEAVGRAVVAGIPVITINSGLDRSAEFGALTHVGQTETVAGRAAGERFKADGVDNLVCVIHAAGVSSLDERCAGAKETLGGETQNLQVDVSDLNAAAATIAAKLQSDPDIDGVLTLNSTVGTAAVRAAETAGRRDLKIATFDLDAQALDAIEAGKILWAVDQQPYLQGYLPVVFLHLNRTNANTVGGGLPVLTGPSFVDRSNMAQVRDYAARGTR